MYRFVFYMSQWISHVGFCFLVHIFIFKINKFLFLDSLVDLEGFVIICRPSKTLRKSLRVPVSASLSFFV